MRISPPPLRSPIASPKVSPGAVQLDREWFVWFRDVRDKLNRPGVGLKIFVNNAAAITGGLKAGDFYRTGADPDVVCVVH